ncbi:MAG: hypothetical protein NZM44_05000 [Candidatus Calescibacterium sp.]|nr:hypothetical protein [Candidatus Calescibacterium sp.]
MIKMLRRKFRQIDKNKAIQEFCAIIIGIGIGLYGYESKVALLPMKWQLDSNVEKSIQQSSLPKVRGEILVAQIFNQDWEQRIGKAKDFWNSSSAERYKKHFEKYRKTMEDWGVRGGMQKKIDELMRSGVEPIPKKWTTKENQPFLMLGLVLVGSACLIKILLYMGIINLNASKLIHGVNWNGIFHDIGTFGMSAIGGMYLQPALEEFLKDESTSYPYPIMSLVLFFIFLLLKIFISSQLIDINAWRRGSGALFSVKRFRQFSLTYNWNDLVHSLTALILGFGFGFYAYESNLALLPLKWQADQKVAKDMTKESSSSQPSILDKISSIVKSNPDTEKFWNTQGLERYTKNIARYDKALQDMGIRGKLKEKVDRFMRQGIEPIPPKWSEPQNRPYVLVGLFVVLLSLLLKILLYMQVIDVNSFLKYHKLRPKSKTRRIDWHEMINDFTTITLSVMVGLYATPFMDYLAGEQAVSYPYPRVGPIIIAICILIKVLLVLGIMKLNRGDQVVAKRR